MSRLQRCLLLFLVALAAMLQAAQVAVALPGPTGTLFAGTPSTGCVASTLGGACSTAAALNGAADVEVSADGAHVYVAAPNASLIATFEREAGGAFTRSVVPCIGAAGSSGCTPATGLGGVAAIVLSPDGGQVYSASPTRSAISALTRDATTGALTQGPNACVADEVQSELGPSASEPGCVAVQGVAGSVDLAASPDGRHIYVAAGVADAVSLLTRSSIDGSLTQPVGVTRCISTDTDPGPVIVLRDPDCEAAAPLAGASAVAVSPDGAHVYVAAAISRTVVVFARNAITGALRLSSCVSDDLGGDTGSVPAQTECSAAQGLGDPAALAISSDGRHVYVASPNAGSVASFERDPQSGGLAQLDPGCLTDSSAPATDAQCVAGGRLNGASDLALSSDGNHLYLTATERDAVVVLSRDAASGQVVPVAGANGCVGSLPIEAGCRHGEALAQPQAIAISPSGRHLVAASGLGTLATLERQLAPVCIATSLVQVAGPTPIPLSCGDPNGDALTYAVIDAPNIGSVTSIDQGSGQALYAPSVGASGHDVFSFTASDDGGVIGAPALASLELAQAPLAAIRHEPVDTRAPQLRVGKLVIDRKRRVRLKVRCPSSEPLGCAGTLSIKTVRKVPVRTLRLAGVAGGPKARPLRVKFVSKLRFRLKGATTRTISTRLKKKHVRLIKRLGKTRVTVTLIARDPAGNFSRSTRKVVLQRRA